MTQANPTSIVVYVGIGALIVWRMYARIRRFVSRQKLSERRLQITIAFFPILVLALLAGTIAHPIGAALEIAGAIAGIALGIIGLRKTKYESTPDGLFYTPNAHIGIALSLLFVGRLAYRYMQTYIAISAFAKPQTDFVSSPITLLVFGTLAGYYTMYAVGLLKWSRSGVHTNPTESVAPAISQDT